MEKVLTEQAIEETYDLLGKMHVPLELVQEKGLDYVKERMALCRAMQDQAQSLRLKTGQALSHAQTQRIYVKHSIPLAASDQEKDQLKIKLTELEQAVVSHSMLHRLVNAQAAALNQTARDIKLLADVMIKQLKLGEMTDSNPTDSPDVLTPRTVEDIAASLPTPTPAAPETVSKGLAITSTRPVAAPTPAPADDLSSLFSAGPSAPAAPAPAAAPPTNNVASFDDAAPEVVPDRIQLADRSSIPIDSLFEELTGGPTSAAL